MNKKLLTTILFGFIILIEIYFFDKVQQISYFIIGGINVFLFLLYLGTLKFIDSYDKAKRRKEELELESFFDAAETYREIFKDKE